MPQNANPGPGAYDIGGTNDGQSFILHEGHDASWIGKSDTPGPKYLPDTSAVHERAPRFTCRPRVYPPEPESQTIEAGYVKLPVPRPGPMTIGQRETLQLIPK
jgi:hypothetical protein